MDERSDTGRVTGSPADKEFLPQERWLPLAFSGLLAAVALYVAFRRTPVLAHDIAEMFSFVVAFGIFMLTWNARKLIDNHYFVFLGIAYLNVGAIDYVHTLSFKGVFTWERHGSSIELWFAARYLQSIALLLAPLFVSRRVRPGLTLAAFAAAALALLGAVYFGIFPDYYVPGKGLTHAKSVSDYVISGILALSIVHLWGVRGQFDPDVLRMLLLSVLLLIAAELSAVLYTDVFVYNSVAGHYLKVVSFYLVYKAILSSGLIRPYTVMFRNLKKSEEEVRAARDGLELRVAERTADLRIANKRLKEQLSDRLVAEEALRQSEDRFRSMAEHALVGTLIVQDGRVLLRNPEQERILGSVPLGVDFRRLGMVHPEDAPKFERFCDLVRNRELFREGMELRFFLPADRKGRYVQRWVQCLAIPIDFQGRPSTLVNMVDITRVKDLEQIVTYREKFASIGQMGAGIAHEIRNPLSGINLNVSTLELLCQRAEGLSPEEREQIVSAVARAKAASEKIAAVIRRIMEFSKPVVPRPDRADLNQVVRESLATPEIAGRKGDVELREHFFPEPLYCNADPALLGQVLDNLVTNAIQAMEEIAVPKRITVSVSREGNIAVVRVADTGPGVPVHLREKIFDPFFTMRRGGHGIGLSLSLRIVSKHGGRILAGSAEGGGAEFRVELPLAEERSRE